MEVNVSVCSSETSNVRVGNVVCSTYGGAELSFLVSLIHFLTSANVFSPANSPFKTRESGNRTATFVLPSPTAGAGDGVFVGVVGVEIRRWCWFLRSSLSFSISWRIFARSSFC